MNLIMITLAVIPVLYPIVPAAWSAWRKRKRRKKRRGPYIRVLRYGDDEEGWTRL